MSLRDRVPRVTKPMHIGERVMAQHPYGDVMPATVEMVYRFTAILTFDARSRGAGGDTWHVGHAFIEPMSDD